MRIYPFLIILFSTIYSYSQTIQITPSPGSVTHCPDELLDYTATIRNSSGNIITGCSFVWSITNGSFHLGANTGQTVSARWDNVASIGKLKVTITCGSEVSSKEQNFVIRSVTGLAPQNFRLVSAAVPLCSTNPVILTLDHMFVPNTGGTTGITLREVDGYEWEVPSGWSGNSGTELITITPSNGCVEGGVRVRGYVSCNGQRRYSNWSQSLNLRSVQSFAITAPGGASSYTLQCGSANSVTFVATNISCATGYTWTFPPGWQSNGVGSPVITTASSITLTPLPTPQNANIIPGVLTVSANLGTCTRQSTLQLMYSDPKLPDPTPTTSSASLLCEPGSGTVTLNNVTGAGSYSWYMTSSGIVYLNGNTYTSSNPLTTSNTVTVSVPSQPGSNSFSANLYFKANQSNGCASSNYVLRPMWVGPPPQPVNQQYYHTGNPANCIGLSIPNFFTSTYRWTFVSEDLKVSATTLCKYGYIPLEGSSIEAPTLSVGPAAFSTQNFLINSQAKNTCGLSPIFLINIDYYTVPGSLTLSVYPNPASNEITVALEQDTVGYSEINEIALYTKHQQKVLSKKEKGRVLKIPTSNLPDDTYFLKVIIGEAVIERKILVKH